MTSSHYSPEKGKTMNYGMKTTYEARVARQARLAEDRDCLNEALKLRRQEKIFTVALLSVVIIGIVGGLVLGGIV